MTLAAKPGRAPICPSFFGIPFDAPRGPPFGGSFEQRDCATSAVMNGRTDEIIDIATTTVPR
jgi:hypothetical protein